MKYDITLKEIIGKVPAVFIREVLGLPATQDAAAMQVDLSFSSHREPDLIFSLEDKLVHIELQTKNDAGMPLRMLEYFTLLSLYCKNTLKKDYRIVQFVIYTGDEPLRMQDSLELPNISFKYHLIDMKQVSCKKLLEEPSDEAFMLATLCDIDTDTFSREFLKRIKDKDEKALKEFEAKMLTLLNLRPKLFREFKRIEQEVKIMPIPVAETPLYKEGLQEGLQKGLQEGLLIGKKEGLQEGLMKGRVEGIKIALLEDIELKFGTVPEEVEGRIMEVNDTAVLREYKKALFGSQTLEEFLQKIK